MNKRCFKCLCVKPIELFYKHAAMGDGHLGKCKQCTKNDATAHRLANIDRIRAYDIRRASIPHRKAKREQIVRTWAASFPERKRAQSAVGYAIRNGTLTRWPVCAVPECDKPRPEAHHPNYDSPFEVVWLCRAHHMQAHAVSTEMENV